LDKYNKKVPTTWDDLISIGQSILEEERKENNDTEIIGYLGHMPDGN